MKTQNSQSTVNPPRGLSKYFSRDSIFLAPIVLLASYMALAVPMSQIDNLYRKMQPYLVQSEQNYSNLLHAPYGVGDTNKDGIVDISERLNIIENKDFPKPHIISFPSFKRAYDVLQTNQISTHK